MSESLPPIDPFLFFDRENIPWFVNSESYDFFCVHSVGEATIDRNLGEFVANEAMEYARRHRSSAVIAFALMSIAEKQGTGDLEAGFITRIASAVMVASMN